MLYGINLCVDVENNFVNSLECVLVDTRLCFLFHRLNFKTVKLKWCLEQASFF